MLQGDIATTHAQQSMRGVASPSEHAQGVTGAEQSLRGGVVDVVMVHQ